ncbi:uncharacterized protein LOC62_02G002142 [Vanrija pseudolonga]|uniref:Uncharacterized protein n=1 Tax=Vanrija pseudolonga TaxID=143232 RepID=A0AAF0Y215_9TREE|nr:hypothetical protein LOC62_02G002142 [Vanrija pseudolonga]
MNLLPSSTSYTRRFSSARNSMRLSICLSSLPFFWQLSSSHVSNSCLMAPSSLVMGSSPSARRAKVVRLKAPRTSLAHFDAVALVGRPVGNKGLLPAGGEERQVGGTPKVDETHALVAPSVTSAAVVLRRPRILATCSRRDLFEADETVVDLEVAMDDISSVQPLDEPQELNGEEDGHELVWDRRAPSDARSDAPHDGLVDDVQEGALR